ncbi:MAG: PIN domain-containing protein [Acidimicrobiia bacterium]|nr:PIN domain-containing protein [Acidimicrobiia bacterium]MYB25630.1 PIN domain-containing protein [Acidimicrobiia bacterium]MYE67209.1 PIN domain-containing protein [Acidimicrobiia bacterium]MYJ13097.1 PIN domain-containing protein [Acidimicrobiia bacterium]
MAASRSDPGSRVRHVGERRRARLLGVLHRHLAAGRHRANPHRARRRRRCHQRQRGPRLDPRRHLRGTDRPLSAFVDTNVFVYLYDHAEVDKQRVARATLTDAAEDLVISTQVLTEFFWVATRKLNLDPRAAREGVRQMAALRVVPVDHRLVLRATDTALSARLSIWDALIVEAAAAAGADRLLTEDFNAGQIIRDVQVVNPFAASR